MSVPKEPIKVEELPKPPAVIPPKPESSSVPSSSEEIKTLTVNEYIDLLNEDPFYLEMVNFYASKGMQIKTYAQDNSIVYSYKFLGKFIGDIEQFKAKINEDLISMDDELQRHYRKVRKKYLL